MPSKRSKSEEKKRKQLQRLKLSEEKKMDIREKGAKAKCLRIADRPGNQRKVEKFIRI